MAVAGDESYQEKYLRLRDEVGGMMGEEGRVVGREEDVVYSSADITFPIHSLGVMEVYGNQRG